VPSVPSSKLILVAAASVAAFAAMVWRWPHAAPEPGSGVAPPSLDAALTGLAPTAGGLTVPLRRRDGATFRLSELDGKVVVVNFWATWCTPCRMEIPHFNAVAAAYRDRGVEFVGVAMHQEWAEIAPFLEVVPVDYRVVLDDDYVLATAWNVNAMPTTVFLDRSGEPVSSSIGLLRRDALERALDELL